MIRFELILTLLPLSHPFDYGHDMTVLFTNAHTSLALAELCGNVIPGYRGQVNYVQANLWEFGESQRSSIHLQAPQCSDPFASRRNYHSLCGAVCLSNTR